MGGNRSVASCFNLEIFLGLILLVDVQFSDGYTNPTDVAAINSLYISLGSPSIPGWSARGGDPCAGGWQGVTCDASFISTINIVGANLNGELGDSLGSFSSIKTIILSNNFITGSIPFNLPPTLESFFMSDNRLSGSLPSSLSSLTNLTAMSLNKNRLTGAIPDAFEALTKLVNLDISNNTLDGLLPPSMQNLSSLTTLHLQNNLLSGTLDVLQNLPLKDLDIHNNSFSGPIPQKLLSIPNFRRDMNPFNTSAAPLPPPASSVAPAPAGQAPPFFPGPITGQTPPSSGGQRPGRQAPGPSTQGESNSKNSVKSSRTRRIVWIAIVSAVSFVILLLALLLFMPRCHRRKRTYGMPKRHEITPYVGIRENIRHGRSTVQSNQEPGKAVPPGTNVRPKEENQQKEVESIPKQRNEEKKYRQMNDAPRRMSGYDMDMMMPPPPPPLPPPLPSPRPTQPEKVIVNPIAPAAATVTQPLPTRLPMVKALTIASLQQYTNSFSQENLIGGGMLGNVYRAELPNGRLLAIKKLDQRVSNQQRDDQFIDLVNNLDRIRHANVVELVGYCAEHGQRLLVYEYCTNGTLQDALHSDEEFKKELSWNARIRMAFGAARALEYLHEICEPPVIHRNFKSANILLDDELAIRVSDCGLAPLISSGAVSQLSGQLLTTYGYGAPELESGVYTEKSDVYSFGVVMLELLTGRKSYDRSKVRGEQFLVRWAVPQLHDIDALSRMVDPALGGNYPVKSLSHFADIISRCVLAEPEFRPPMSEVVQYLIQMIRKESPSMSSDVD